MTREERFWFNVKRGGDGECWQWLGSTGRGGYARVSGMYAHRYSYEIHRGPIPEGMEIDHTCNTRECTNPAHLEAVTHAENMQRGVDKRDSCAKGHLWTPENIATLKNGRRWCRACGLERDKAYRARQGDAWREKHRIRTQVRRALRGAYRLST